MAVSICKMKENGDFFLSEIGIATQRRYNELWRPAINELGLKYWTLDIEVTGDKLPDMLNELNQVEKWAESNLSGNDLSYILANIKDIRERLPTMLTCSSDRVYVG